MRTAKIKLSGNELNKDPSLTIETDKERTDAHFNFMKNTFYYSNSGSLMFEGNWEVNIELYLLSFTSLKAQPLLLRCFPLDSLKSQTEKNVSLTQ